MRSFIVTTVLALLLGSLAATAQPRFKVIQPQNGALSFACVVGQEVTRQVQIIRYDPNLETLAIIDMDVPFSTPANPIVFMQTDTLTVDFTFTPQSVGQIDVPIQFHTGNSAETLVLRGFGFAMEDERFESSSEDVDLGHVIDDATSIASFVLTNKWVQDLTLSWESPGPELQFYVDGVETTEVTIPMGTKKVVTVYANGGSLQPGYWERMISVGDGNVIGPGNQTVTAIGIRLHGVKVDSKADPIRFNPDPVTIFYDPMNSAWMETAIVVTNISSFTVLLNDAAFIGPEASDFVILNTGLFPVSMAAGQSVTILVTSTTQNMDSVISTLEINGAFADDTASKFVDRVTVTAAGVIEQAPPIMLTMTANDAKVGEVCRAVFTNGSDLPGDADHAIVTLRYNTTVLVPRTSPLDLEDPISEGKRTSRFKLTPDGHNMGQRAGEVEFDVVLGNSSSTVLEVVSIDWKDEANNSLGMTTQVNGTTVSVLDAEGFEINADAGPLSMSVTPMPITGSGTVRYDVGGLPDATLKMYDRTGSMVADLTANLTQGDGTFTLSASPFPKGFYYLQLAGGPYTFVSLVIME